jgi:hydroxyacylglutathione hydrolase
VFCWSGYRSSVAASLLLARGQRNLINVIGGMDAWNQAQLPTRRDDA